VGMVHAVYARCSQNRKITGWDFREIGFPVDGEGWRTLRIWPAFPANEHEFWLYVAHTALENKASIPEFMLPVTDLAPIQERLFSWRRSQEIEKWKDKLGSLNIHARSADVESHSLTDLR